MPGALFRRRSKSLRGSKFFVPDRILRAYTREEPSLMRSDWFGFIAKSRRVPNSMKLTTALVIINQCRKDSSNGLVAGRICPLGFGHCETASTQPRVDSKSVMQVCGFHRCYMLADR